MSFTIGHIMNASIVDLRYKTSAILKALERQEEVNILYHGKVKGVIVPLRKPSVKASKHPFFGMTKSDKEPVHKVMARLREGRIRDI